LQHERFDANSKLHSGKLKQVNRFGVGGSSCHGLENGAKVVKTCFAQTDRCDLRLTDS
jgi:hypothetical protein